MRPLQRCNKPAPWLTRGRMRGAVVTNKKQLLARRRDGEAAGDAADACLPRPRSVDGAGPGPVGRGVFQQPKTTDVDSEGK